MSRVQVHYRIQISLLKPQVVGKDNAHNYFELLCTAN